MAGAKEVIYQTESYRPSRPDAFGHKSGSERATIILPSIKFIF